MTIITQLKEDIIKTIKKLFRIEETLLSISLEFTKDPLNGDLSTNAAMILAKKLQKSPKEIGAQIKEELSSLYYIAHIEIAGQGFINFTIHANMWQKILKEIISSKIDDLIPQIGNGEKINLEYVSANPTGPMHIGHARGAIFGDTLATLLLKSGYKVTKEFYVNDYGNQINNLINSVFLRYKAAFTKDNNIKFGEHDYTGEYLIPIGKELVDIYKDSLLDFSPDSKEKIKTHALKEMLNLIKKDLKDLGIYHDIFTHESSLYKDNKIQELVEELKAKGDVIFDFLEKPKNYDDNWKPQKHLIFRASKYGDDQDRALTRSNSDWSYFAGDVAYAKNKLERNFKNIVMVLGADHIGYAARIKGIFTALSENTANVEIKLCQLVNYLKAGKPIKMSKRSGTFLTVRDVLDEIGSDALRFMMLTRKNDVQYDFDIDKVKEHSKDNPVFYVQYAYVRAKSVINNARTNATKGYDIFYSSQSNLSLLNTEEEIHLMKKLAAWQIVVTSAIKYYEPHRIAFYLQDLASEFHRLWNLGKDEEEYRFVNNNNIELTASRIALAQGVINIIATALNILNIKLLEKM